MARALRLALTLAAAAPLAASAAAGPTLIRNSAHDLSSTGSQAVKATVETNLCKFCHTPHRAQTTNVLWNHTEISPGAVFNWGTDGGGTPITTTSSNTTLPTTLRPASRRCLGCHDGSIAVGDVSVSGGGPNPIQMNASADLSGGKIIKSNKMVGAGGNLGGEHPFGVPYPGRTYAGRTSGVTADRVNDTTGDYFQVKTAGCGSPSAVCTTATVAGANNVAGVDGGRINLLPDTPGNTTDVGIECTTCHEPHNAFGFAKMMRVDTAGSALCMSCHNP